MHSAPVVWLVERLGFGFSVCEADHSVQMKRVLFLAQEPPRLDRARAKSVARLPRFNMLADREPRTEEKAHGLE